jgi:DUF4097 and DUF4098 domain-containing protein YvlB
MTNLFSAITVAAALLFSSACDLVVDVAAQTVTGSFERTLSVSGPVSLAVRTGSGNIRITTGSGEAVRVVGRISTNRSLLGVSPAERVSRIEKAPPIEQNGSSIRIGLTDDEMYNNVSISYEITVPVAADVDARTGSGDQFIGNVRGMVTARTGSGNIDLAEAGGEVHAHTGSGGITVAKAGGPIEAQTGSGNILVKSVSGAISARTGSGSVDMTQTARGDAEVRTGSGSVRLTLPSDAAFDLSARTGSGSISVNQRMTMREMSRHRLEGTVGNGGSKVNVTTGSGSITIR